MFLVAYGVMSFENYKDWNWFLQKLKNLIRDKDVVILSNRHSGLFCSVLEQFGGENQGYCYSYLKENFSSFFNKYNTRGIKGKENALQWLDKIVYARLETDYNAHMNKLCIYNDSLAVWIEQNEPKHRVILKFPKKEWNKMTTNLVESFNAWLRDERHHSICSFLIKHITKLGAMLVKHKAKSNKWKCSIRPKIDHKVKINIIKDEVYTVSPFSESFFGVFVGTSILNVDIKKRTCLCQGWEISSIPCKHACVVI